jgi:hypothetical protein
LIFITAASIQPDSIWGKCTYAGCDNTCCNKLFPVLRWRSMDP